jgi:ABC-type amino acid transport substrate-binding protein
VAVATSRDIPLETEVLSGFARSLGAELRLTRAGTSEAALQALLEGRSDLTAGGLVSTRAAPDRISWTGEVFPTRFVVVSRALVGPWAYIEDLRTADTILAPESSGAAVAAAAAKLPGSKTVTNLTPERARAALAEGRNAALLLDLLEALSLRREDPQLRLGVALGERQSVVFAVAKAETALADAFSSHVKALRASPSYRMLLVRALGPDVLGTLSRARLE